MAVSGALRLFRLHTAGVAGSIPAAPTNQLLNADFRLLMTNRHPVRCISNQQSPISNSFPSLRQSPFERSVVDVVLRIDLPHRLLTLAFFLSLGGDPGDA